MNLYVVFCHPNRTSYTGAVLDSFLEGAKEAGHSCEVADLHGMGFNPVFSPDDFHLFRTGEGLSEELKHHQNLIDWAEGLVFIYPIWWFYMPAMLKGWFDRVFSNGWMYHYEMEEGPEPVHVLVTRPVLEGKKILQLCPAGNSKRTYDRYGYASGLGRLVDTGIFRYCQSEDYETHILTDIDKNPKARADHLRFAFEKGRDIAPSAPGTRVQC